jgi:hypothetical protein
VTITGSTGLELGVGLEERDEELLVIEGVLSSLTPMAQLCV